MRQRHYLSVVDSLLNALHKTLDEAGGDQDPEDAEVGGYMEGYKFRQIHTWQDE